MRRRSTGDPAGLARALAPLRPLEPEPLAGDGWAIVSASPELLLQRRGRFVRTSPIKGTRPAGVPIESAKDTAEHVMIVDLERNDLSRVCAAGSVHWPQLLAERQLAGVAHLVATVEGELREDVTLTELLDAVLPGGSVTGCPKIAALDLIAALEPVGRGASMGALGRDPPERRPRPRAHDPHLRRRRGAASTSGSAAASSGTPIPPARSRSRG